jgi:alkylation response protein AidB-like acyl-CoA dehydrogenase
MSDTTQHDSDSGSLDEQLRDYRERVIRFLATNATRFSGAVRLGLTAEQDVALGRAWQRLKCESGFAAITVPARYGGAGGTQLQKIVFAEEESKYDLPTHYFAVSLSNPIPIMAAYALEEQKERLIPPAVRGETIWCQLFSEPAAGSDLAALRLSARLEGNQWRLNGQKLWTSWAQLADYGVIVARSDPSAPKHQGLTYFFLDMKSSGVRVRPIKLLSGSSHVCEVFFDDVMVPDDQRLGPVGGGFKVALHTLMIERYSVMDIWGHGPDLSALLAVLRDVELNGAPALVEPALRELITDAIIEERALTEINRRAFAAMQAGHEPGPEGSINKLLIANKRQKLARMVMDLLGPQALALVPGVTSHENFTASWLSAPLLRVAGGTDQILRNTIAERLLGLPQDHRPDKGVPFNQLPT